MKTITQSGFHRIPKNPKQRPFNEDGTKPSRTALETFNEKAEDRWLHPTNGWRNFNVKTSRAEALVTHIRNGGSASLEFMRKFLRGEA